MGSYRLEIKCSAVRELEDLPYLRRKYLVQKIPALQADPRPCGCEKLTAQERYRIRQGQHRILYEIDDTQSLATIAKTGHRRDIYRS